MVSRELPRPSGEPKDRTTHLLRAFASVTVKISKSKRIPKSVVLPFPTNPKVIRLPQWEKEETFRSRIPRELNINF